MYEYKFVRVEVSVGLFGTSVSGDYQEIVHKHAAEGWRLAHVLSGAGLPIAHPAGKPIVCDLVFERGKA